jgi:hypothetical protein
VVTVDDESAALGVSLERDFGRAFHLVGSERFVVISDAGRAQAERRVATLEKTARRFFDSMAAFQPVAINRPLPCVAFKSSADFERYARIADGRDMSWTRGYYSARTNRIALFEEPGDEHPHDAAPPLALAAAEVNGSPSDPARSPDDNPDATELAKTTHEAAHQLAFNTGIQKRGVMYPLWLSEGLASNFELADRSGAFGPDQDNAYRRGALLRAARRGGLLPLEDLATLTRVPVGDGAAVNAVYAQAWGLFHFFYARHPRRLAAYLAALAALEPGARSEATLRAEFVAAFGEIHTVERDWREYVSREMD